ncbi:MAG: NAD+ synthase [Candidatus Latescibacteria bacterium]|nr:NAD+ synthase [Candidatus Latescibacterota bacterium]
MRNFRVTLAQINTTVGDLDGNVARCLDAVEMAKVRSSDLVVFPELALTGYPPEDLLLKPGFLRECRKALERFTNDVDDICAVVGFVDGAGPVYNAAAVVYGQTVQCVYHKMILPNYGVFDEKRYFAAGKEPVSFKLGDCAIGLSICEDIWVGDGPYRALFRDHKVDMLLNLSASPFHTGKIHERTDMLGERSKSNATPVVYVNLVGGQDELVFDGGSLVFDGTGKCITRLPSFEESVTAVDLAFEGNEPEDRLACVQIKPAERNKPVIEPLLFRELIEEEEILDALVLGTRDYIRKNGFTKVVIGLSGGIDSALVAVIAARALGPDNVIGVTMPSRYTSEGTRSDAEVLADNLGIRFMEIPISGVFDTFNDTLAVAFEGCKPDVTEENIQARIRGTLLMALSNKFGWLVLTTGNKSEMATGYATLYGDMAGGFAVIKDVPKLMVYRISRLINRQAGSPVIPEGILTRPPSAELRPDQKDSDSLPDYDILDPILKAYIEEDRGVEDIVSLGFDREIVRHIVRLSDRSEYKRRQAPPGVKITPRAFGRDRRLPITNRFKP